MKVRLWVTTTLLVATAALTFNVNTLTVNADSNTETTTESDEEFDYAKYYEALYGPKNVNDEDFVKITLDGIEYDVPYMSGAPTSVYYEIAKNIAIAEKSLAENEKAREDGTFVYSAESYTEADYTYTPDGSCLTPSAGVYNGPSGKETYYNLDMSGVVSIMRGMGYGEEEYPYWVREDGAKMFGPYVMVAAELSSRPKGTLLPTSLGTGIVVDTGGFAASNPTQLDIAVNW
jgi:hypothetical protein